MNTDRICLGTQDHGLSGDTYYHLFKDRNGEWQIESTRYYEQAFKGPHNLILEKEKWGQIFIEGKSLADLAQEHMLSN
jgi:hypothetical protein